MNRTVLGYAIEERPPDVRRRPSDGRIRRLGRLIGRGPREWTVIGRVVVTHARVRASLRRRGFPDTARRLGLAASGPESSGTSSGAVSKRAGRLLWVSDRVLWSKAVTSTCLSRALTTQRLLTRAGFDVETVIGVSRKTGFEAHAWLEIGGTPLSGFAGPDAYAPIARFRATADRQP